MSYFIFKLYYDGEEIYTEDILENSAYPNDIIWYKKSFEAFC